MVFPERKHPRLKQYDYSQCGCYHITLCVKNRQPILSQVVPAPVPTERATVSLSTFGHIVTRYIQNIPAVYPCVELIKYVVMPNHIHLLIALSSGSSVSIPTIVRSLKRMVTRELQQSIWQNSYYDVVIRNDVMFQCEWNYIDTNPDKWIEDELYVAPC